MARPRLELHNELLQLAPHVYFQPPESLQIQYPCIIYKRDFAETAFADNSPYRNTKRYQVTVIDEDPDSTIPDQVAKLRMCSFLRFFTTQHLNHDIYILYH